MTSIWAVTSPAGLELALQPESGLPAEQQLLDNAREVLMKRLDYLGIQNAEVTVDSEESRLLVRFPNQPGVSQSDYPEIVSVLTSRNALTVRDGIASDEQGRPTRRNPAGGKGYCLRPGLRRPEYQHHFRAALPDRGRSEQI